MFFFEQILSFTWALLHCTFVQLNSGVNVPFDQTTVPICTGDSSSSDDEDGDEMKYAEQSNMISKIDTKNRVSVRNLRIREDTAKYLRNLDVNSSHYDPKTRTMRANPYEGADPSSVPFAGGSKRKRIHLTCSIVDWTVHVTEHPHFGSFAGGSNLRAWCSVIDKEVQVLEDPSSDPRSNSSLCMQYRVFVAWCDQQRRKGQCQFVES